MTTPTIPAELVRVMRSAVLTLIGDTASEIADASTCYEKEQYREAFAEPFARFDALRALLDVIGWRNVERSFHVQEHREQLLGALEDRLTVNRDCIRDSWTEPVLRKRIERETRCVERFIAANGLQEGDA
jgi:hypothetical protein